MEKQSLMPSGGPTAKTPPRRGGGGGGSGSNNAFFVSQRNYLDLKLQALDQAIVELIPREAKEILDERERQLRLTQPEKGGEKQHNESSKGGASDNDLHRTNSLSTSGKERKERGQAMPIQNNRTKLTSPQNNKSVGISTSLEPQKLQQKPPLPRQQQQQHQQQHRAQSADDELDTIDVYFRPKTNTQKHQIHQHSPSPRNQYQYTLQDQHRSKSPSHHSNDSLSGITWDGSLELQSSSKQHRYYTTNGKYVGDEASEGGLSDVLGPMSDDDGLSDVLGPMMDNKHSIYRSPSIARPPSGATATATAANTMMEKQQRQSQVSPKSVTDFPPSSFDDTDHYNNNLAVADKTNSRITAARGRGTIRGQPQQHQQSYRRPPALSNEATEAARKGVLRALSEDDSECLSLDDDNFTDYRHHSFQNHHDTSSAFRSTLDLSHISEQPSLEYSALHSEIGRSAGSGGGKKATRLFSGTTDRISNANNSLIESVLNEDESRYGVVGGTSSDARARGTAAAAAANITNNAPNSNNGFLSSARDTDDGKTSSTTSLQQSGHDDYYDSLLNSGIDFADELCVSLRTCWNNVIGEECATTNRSTIADPEDKRRVADSNRMKSQADDVDITRDTEDESTYCSRGESTAYTRSTTGSGEEESTAFHTTSSFSRGATESSPNAILRKGGMKKGNGHDEKARMLV